jgi:hypothetical protein
MEECGKSVRLPGLFVYTLRKARDYYKCWYCNGPISPGTLYVEERFPGVVRRYHVYCVSKSVPRVVFRDAPSGGVLCAF